MNKTAVQMAVNPLLRQASSEIGLMLTKHGLIGALDKFIDRLAYRTALHIVSLENKIKKEKYVQLHRRGFPS